MPYLYVKTKSKKSKKSKKAKKGGNGSRKKAVDMLLYVAHLTDDHVRIRAFAKTLAGDVHRLKSPKDLEENVYKARHLADMVLDLIQEQDYSDSSVAQIENRTRLAEATHDVVKYTTDLVGVPKKKAQKREGGWYKSEWVKKPKKTKKGMHNPWVWNQVHAPKPKFVAPWADKNKKTLWYEKKGSSSSGTAAKKKTQWYEKKGSSSARERSNDDVVIVSDSMEAKRKSRVTPKGGMMNYWDKLQGQGHQMSAPVGHKFTVNWRKTRKSQRKKSPEVIVIDDD
jgi:hypothetical protein